MKRFVFITIMISGFSLLSMAAPGAGAAFCLRSSYGPNTFRLAPGVSLFISAEIIDNLELRADFFTGSLIGNSLGGSVSGHYHFFDGIWRPSVGIFFSLDYGSYLFHTSGTDIEVVLPFRPEPSAGIAVSPFRFVFGDKSLSFINIFAGINLAYPGRVFVFGIDILRLNVLIGSEGKI